nr:hypothetical protein [Nocardia cyriacigeorgica]
MKTEVRFSLHSEQGRKGSAGFLSRPTDLTALDAADGLRVNRRTPTGRMLDLIAHQLGQLGLCPATSQPARPEIGVRRVTPQESLPLFAYSFALFAPSDKRNAEICPAAGSMPYLDMAPRRRVTSTQRMGERMRHQPTALAWIHPDVSRAPEWEAAQLQRLARRLGYVLVWPRHCSSLPLSEQVRNADVDALVIPTPDHIDPIVLNAVMYFADVEIACPRLSFARWSIIGAM